MRLIARDAESFRGVASEAALVVDLWFAEERGHSRLLAQAVQRVHGEFITDTFAFRLFNQCRRVLGVQFEMLVLLIVEIVSTGYYRVIRRHVGDEPIAAVCRLILRDEARHIDFHRDRLAARYPHGFGFWRACVFRVLGHACVWFLWLGHGRCLRILGGSRDELFHHVRGGMSSFLSELAQATSALAGSRPSTSASCSHPVESEVVQ
ncbi:MAG: ferritin-like domain-containing protein [Chthoniobacteraceae bacterium]